MVSNSVSTHPDFLVQIEDGRSGFEMPNRFPVIHHSASKDLPAVSQIPPAVEQQGLEKMIET
jgi:hypothetical protein